jgi:iron(III) transport system permease protein
MSEAATSRRGRGGFTALALLCAAIVLLLLVYPLLRMVWQTLAGGHLTQALSVVWQPWFAGVFINTAVVVGCSALLAVLVGTGLAWINQRTDAGLGALGTLMPIIPLLIPNVAMSIGWVFIAAPRVGFLNGWLALLPDWMSFRVNIYSWAGLIFMYAINGVPYVYLIVAAALRNIDPALEEAARINGAGLARTFWRVSAPAVRPAMFSALVLVTINGIGMYAIPAVIGTTARIDVMTTRIVYLLNREFPPRLPEAEMIGIVMLILVGGLWYLHRRSTGKGQFATIGGRAAGGGKLEMGVWKWPARLATLAFLACTSALPVFALAVVSLQPFWTPAIDAAAFSANNYVQALFVNSLASAAISNSLVYSSIGALIAMSIAIVIAIYAANRRGGLVEVIEGSVKSSASIPHLILAVGFLIAFSGAPFYLSGTAAILILAFVIMYISPGSIAAASAIVQIGRDLREAAEVNGASEGRIVRRILLPLAMPGFMAGWAIVFVQMMGDLSAAALLAGIKNPVVGFAILSIWEAGTFGVLAAFSMMLCLTNIFVISAMFGVGRLIARR